MSVPNGRVTLTWGDGEYDFNIAKIKQVLELEEKCNAGVGAIYSRLLSGMSLAASAFYFNDFRETIRLALIGGGMEPSAAVKLVKAYVDERPWQESIRPALVILQAALVGVEGDNDVGKGGPDRATSGAGTTGSSDPDSTASARPSGSRRARSTT